MCARRAAAVLIAVLAIAACRDFPSPIASSGLPSAEISDGAHGNGNPYFYFLTPMVSNPGSGVNVTGLSPVVDICAWDGAACTADLAHFTTDLATTTTSQPGNSETVRESDDGYIVNWHTADFDLMVGGIYRVCVRAGGLALGYSDVDVVGSGKDLKNVNTGEYVALLDDRTLPIRFRIEDGALGAGTSASCSSSQPE
jgi:hypothetical protein